MKTEVEEIARTELPLDESLVIKKFRMESEDANGKRICVVTGIHGDELEGQFVCYELARRIRENEAALGGIVDIYPAMNPFGIDSITRGIPAFDLDMNRVFPGNREGDMNEYMVSKMVEDIEGADLVLDIHASNIFLTELPQIRINELHRERLVPYAEKANVDFIWVHGASTVLESTFAYSMNSRNTPTLVVEMGVGMRITESYGKQMVEGIFSLMRELGIWAGNVEEIKNPVISYDMDGSDVIYLNAPVSGVYIKDKSPGSLVQKGERVGRIINPLEGTLLADIIAPEDGWLFTTREYPVVEEGSLMGRILKQEIYENSW